MKKKGTVIHIDTITFNTTSQREFTCMIIVIILDNACWPVMLYIADNYVIFKHH